MSDCAILPQDDRPATVQPGAGRTDRVLTVLAIASVTALTALGWVMSHGPTSACPVREDADLGGHAVAALHRHVRLRGRAGGHPRSPAGTVHDVLLDAIGALLCGHRRWQRHDRRGRSHGPGRTRYPGGDDGPRLAPAVQVPHRQR